MNDSCVQLRIWETVTFHWGSPSYGLLRQIILFTILKIILFRPQAQARPGQALSTWQWQWCLFQLLSGGRDQALSDWLLFTKWSHFYQVYQVNAYNSSGYVMTGFWEYFGPDGILYRTDFTADEGGYRPQTTKIKRGRKSRKLSLNTKKIKTFGRLTRKRNNLRKQARH